MRMPETMMQRDVARPNLTRWISALNTTLALMLAGAVPLRAQCVLCYMSAASTGSHGAHVLRMGIIVLVVPAVLLFAGVVLLAVRRRNPAPDGSIIEASSITEANAEEIYLHLSDSRQGHSSSSL